MGSIPTSHANLLLPNKALFSVILNKITLRITEFIFREHNQQLRVNWLIQQIDSKTVDLLFNFYSGQPKITRR